MQCKLRISGFLLYGLLLVTACLFDGAAAATSLPLLPMPRYAAPGHVPYIFRPGASPAWKGLDGPAEQRLQWHWQRLQQLVSTIHGGLPDSGQDRVGAGGALQAGILGKDPSFDELVTKMAASWRDSIGDQGYILLLNKKGCLIAAKTETGLFYGLQSLRQLDRAKWDREILVADWP